MTKNRPAQKYKRIEEKPYNAIKTKAENLTLKNLLVLPSRDNTLLTKKSGCAVIFNTHTTKMVNFKKINHQNPTMFKKDQFQDEDGEPITIQFKDSSGLQLLINKLKNQLFSN